MEYRITKIKTKDHQFGTPVSISLDEVVKRMASDKHAQAVEDIAHGVTRSLILKKEKGWEGFGIKGMDDLPCLIFSATFGRQGLQEYRQPTGLVLLSADYGLDMHRMQAIRESAIQNAADGTCIPQRQPPQLENHCEMQTQRGRPATDRRELRAVSE